MIDVETKCRYCGSKNIDTLLRQIRVPGGILNYYCRSCGMGSFTHDIPARIVELTIEIPKEVPSDAEV